MTDAPLAPPPAARPPAASPPARGSGLLAWLRVIGMAVLAALLLRVLAFEAYRIPSGSMEDTLLAGDFIFVSKLGYGARLPRWLGGPVARLPGLAPVRRGDVVVFNYPPQPGPVERRTPFVKRAVGLPGDTVRIVEKRVRVNGDSLAAPAHGRHLWRLRVVHPDSLDTDALAALGVRDRGGHGTERLVEASADGARRIRSLGGVAFVVPFVRPSGDGSARFPAGPAYTLDDYGPVVVPRRGREIRLTDATWALYREAIAREAAARGLPEPRRTAEGFVVDGARAERYTFREDHLFAMGDNRDDSEDSRTWGFVPMSFVIGRAGLVYFSWDPEAEKPRWGRAMRPVD